MDEAPFPRIFVSSCSSGYKEKDYGLQRLSQQRYEISGDKEKNRVLKRVPAEVTSIDGKG